MNKAIFIYYNKCGTCQKALKWLNQRGIEFESRDIITANPQITELMQWISQSGLPINKFFNTSGVRYRELGLKDIIKNASQEELTAILASEGKLVKRPLLIYNEDVIVGFDALKYEEIFKDQ